MTPLSSSPYSYHFFALKFLGHWVYYADGVREENGVAGGRLSEGQKVNLYALYRLTNTCMASYGVVALLVDFVQVMGDMKKMTWNLCVTTILIGSLFKNWEMTHRNATINQLRQKLHRDAEGREAPEDVFIHDMALKELKCLRAVFYGAAVIFMPTWIVTRYNDRELPIPFALPDFIDVKGNDLHFISVFLSLGFSATAMMMITTESELAMYSLLIQISREYRILLKDINLINPLYCTEEDRHYAGLSAIGNSAVPELQVRKKEVNPLLKMAETKMLLRRFCERQNALIGYTEAFELAFNRPLLQQFFGMSVLIVVLALQLLWESVDFSANFFYQMGYLYITIMDMFMMCWYSTRLRSQCLDVGETFYSTLWYRMEAEVRKDISMMIMRSQRPPRITIGKFMELSLNNFLNTMSHIYSWLALVRQFE